MTRSVEKEEVVSMELPAPSGWIKKVILLPLCSVEFWGFSNVEFNW